MQLRSHLLNAGTATRVRLQSSLDKSWDNVIAESSQSAATEGSFDVSISQ
jgi:hypothetical protein